MSDWLQDDRRDVVVGRITQLEHVRPAVVSRVARTIITPNAMQAKIDAAVSAERERCAKILESFWTGLGPNGAGDLQQVIARIRSGR